MRSWWKTHPLWLPLALRRRGLAETHTAVRLPRKRRGPGRRLQLRAGRPTLSQLHPQAGKEGGETEAGARGLAVRSPVPSAQTPSARARTPDGQDGLSLAFQVGGQRGECPRPQEGLTHQEGQ